MATLLWSRSEVTSTPSVRWSRSSAAGDVPIFPTILWSRSDASGQAILAVAPFAALTVEPTVTVSLTAVTTGGTPDAYLWRVISGGVTLIGTGDERHFVAPSIVPPGLTVQVGVRAVLGATPGPEQIATVTVLPQLQWSRRPGGFWAGAPTQTRKPGGAWVGPGV